MKRAPFIWTSTQKIDAEGKYAALRGKPERAEGLNRWFLFRRRLELDFTPTRAFFDVTCDGKYQLFVNGVRIGRGPVRCAALHQRFDRYQNVEGLRKGANTICVLVHTYGLDTAAYEGIRGHWRPTFGEGALWLDGGAVGRDAESPLQTDLNWRALECDAWRSDTPQVNSGLGFIEEFDARRFPSNWTDPAFDDAGWERAHILTAGGGGPEARHGGEVTQPFPVLIPSDLPHQQEGAASPTHCVWARHAQSTDSSLIEQAYEGPLGALLPELRARFEPLIGEGDAEIVTPPDAGVAVLFDFGEIQAGRPLLEINAKGGEIFDIVVSERLPGEFEPEGIAPGARIARHPMLGLDAHVSRYIARPGRQVFETFEWEAVRWLQLTISNAPEGVRLRKVQVTTTRYPAAPLGAFECSDPDLNRLWRLGRRTLELCMHDAWIDCPSREQRQWLGDATIEHLVGEAAFGQEIHALNRHFLRSAAESQRTDGLLEMFAPGDHRRFGWVIPDFTLQWIFNLADHFAYSGDRALVRELFPTLLKGLAWFERLQGEDGRIADLPYWHFQDWAAVGRTGYATVLNAEFVGALRIAQRLAEGLGWREEAERLAANAARIKLALEKHWDDHRGVYVDIVDPETGVQDVRVSQHANAAMILWAGVSAEREQRIASVIGDRSRLRLTLAPPMTLHGEPFDPRTDIVLANAIFSHFVYAALAQAGRFDLALALMRERHGGMAEMGATSLWEGFEPVASLAHGASATPTWQLSRFVLGVSPAEPGFASVRVAPYLGDLAFARGTHPTCVGGVHVAIERSAEGMIVDVTLPEGVPGILDPPPGYVVEGAVQLASGPNRRILRAGTHRK